MQQFFGFSDLIGQALFHALFGRIFNFQSKKQIRTAGQYLFPKNAARLSLKKLEIIARELFFVIPNGS